MMYGDAANYDIPASSKSCYSVFLRTERNAQRIAGYICILRTHGNFLCGAVGVTIVIHAVLYIALNALNMATVATVLLFFHDLFPRFLRL